LHCRLSGKKIINGAVDGAVIYHMYVCGVTASNWFCLQLAPWPGHVYARGTTKVLISHKAECLMPKRDNALEVPYIVSSKNNPLTPPVEALRHSKWPSRSHGRAAGLAASPIFSELTLESRPCEQEAAILYGTVHLYVVHLYARLRLTTDSTASRKL
jgi:hypothetical protein